MKQLFNDGRIEVSTNNSGEIFVKALGVTSIKNMPIEVRIGRAPRNLGLEITSYGCTFEPTSFNGLGGFNIH